MNMTKSAVALAIAALLSTSAHAGVSRAWVSGSGVDNGTCGQFSSPCRTIAGAIANLNPGGEIDVLNPAGYGTFTIPFAMSIINGTGGFTAGVIQTLSGQPAITISAGATDVIVLRGLTIEGTKAGGTGIQVNSAGSVTLENSTVSDFTGWGVSFQPNNSGGTNGGLIITNSSIHDNGAGDVLLQPGGTSGVRATLTNAFLGRTNGTAALQVDGSASTGSNGVKATLVNSLISHIGSSGTGDGVFAEAPSTGQLVHVMVNSSELTEISGNALHADGSSAVIDLNASNMAHVGNVLSLTNSGAANSFGDNSMHFYTSFTSSFGSLSMH